ncbi:MULTISPECIES: hypothetical protein [Fructobacillus]|uniref:DUF2283 domain-containing protein n=1 Tax=Fructobacillus apis TaxID=2935017 RepID=A0ABT0ZPJ5_9LACO|nr:MULTISPECIES: hypothetical protein [Fructobacillus]MCK8639010.1 hypothetical protein [Fructobacillus fructosus]MCO0831920.1 hypothetical protein [Fructobacillus apis]
MKNNFKVKYDFLGKRIKAVSTEGDVVYGTLTTQNNPLDTESGEVEYDILGDNGQRYSASESEIKSMTVID